MNKIFLFLEILVTFFAVSSCLLLYIEKKLSIPYMDEIFHVPQVQRYCDGQYSQWDPMITTLPGLYMTSLAVLKPVEWIFSVPLRVSCTVMWLRGINVLVATLNMLLIYTIISHKRALQTKRAEEGAHSLLTSVALATLPVLYFFTFLYYTDAASLMFVLMAYLAFLKKFRISSACALSMAIMCRQTNVVWVLYFAGVIAAHHVNSLVTNTDKQISKEQQREWSYVHTTIHTILTKSTLKDLIGLAQRILFEAYAYIFVAVGFILFVYVNGGIVVGAKTDHVAGLHFAQLYYFSAFCGIFAFPHLISLGKIKEFLLFVKKNIIVVVIFCAVSCYLIWNFTHAHRYLLSDNRHYTFYIWSRVLNRNAYAKLVLIPAYLYAFWSINSSTSDKDVLWKCVFLICLAINIVPSMLFELRYFIIPYMIWRLNMNLNSTIPKLALEIVFNIFINGITLYLYLEKPFHWPNDTTLQRFMW